MRSGSPESDLLQQLCIETGQSLPEDALKVLSCTNPRIESLLVEEDWRQRGGETFTQIFSVVDEIQGIKRYILKCPISLAMPASATLNIWLERRRMIGNLLCWAVPELYYANRGTICEEFIPFELSQRVDDGSRVSKEILENLASVALVLGRLGFRPLSLHDLRTRGMDCVLVDFGSDLGGPLGGSIPTSEESLQPFAQLLKNRFSEFYEIVQTHGN